MRYQIKEGSESGHCCFEFTVVDTSQLSVPGKDIEGHAYYESVCECFDQESAEMICSALNGGEFKYQEKSKEKPNV